MIVDGGSSRVGRTGMPDPFPAKGLGTDGPASMAVSLQS